MLKVTSLPGTGPTTFIVEGETLQCVNPMCGKKVCGIPPEYARFTRQQRLFLCAAGLLSKVEARQREIESYTAHRKDEKCRKCGGEMRRMDYLVDIADDQCGCEAQEFIVSRKRKAGEEQARCVHLEAAREFAVEIAIASFKMSRKGENCGL